MGNSCLMVNIWNLCVYRLRTAMKLHSNRLELILKPIGLCAVNIECGHFNRLQNKTWSRAGTGNDRIVFIGLMRVSVFIFSRICSRNLDLRSSLRMCSVLSVIKKPQDLYRKNEKYLYFDLWFRGSGWILMDCRNNGIERMDFNCITKEEMWMTLWILAQCVTAESPWHLSNFYGNFWNLKWIWCL